ncbi:hypothetical protein ABPG75_004820 [Micractinium tetrahymenae]
MLAAAGRTAGRLGLSAAAVRLLASTVAGTGSAAAAEARPWTAPQLAAAACSSLGSGFSWYTFSSSAGTAPTPEQAAAAARLVALSRLLCSRPLTSEEQQRQHIVQLLQLGFAEAALGRLIEGQRGGPYVAWQSVADTVALLRQKGFNQKQLDMLLAARSGSSSVFNRQPSDVEDNLR